jgi:hypothetical protein
VEAMASGVFVIWPATPPAATTSPGCWPGGAEALLALLPVAEDGSIPLLARAGAVRAPAR